MPKLFTPKRAYRHIRALLFGPAGAGKSHLALSGPQPVLFPTEGRYDNFLDLFDFQVVSFDDNRIVDEAEEALNTAMHGRYDKCGTFVMDSYTVLEKALRATLDYNVDDAKHRLSELGKRRERFEDDLLNPLQGTSACHILYICHEGNVFSADGRSVIDRKPDAQRNLAYAFDIVARIFIDDQSKRRKAQIYKSAYEHILPTGKIIDQPTWDTLFGPLINVDPAKTGGNTEPPRPVASGNDIAPPTNLPTPDSLRVLWEAAGLPAGNFRVWLESQQLLTESGTMTADLKLRAKQVLEDMIPATTPSTANHVVAS